MKQAAINLRTIHPTGGMETRQLPRKIPITAELDASSRCQFLTFHPKWLRIMLLGRSGVELEVRRKRFH